MTPLLFIVDSKKERIAVEDLALHTPDLDDVFLTLTGKRTDEAATPDEQKAEARS